MGGRGQLYLGSPEEKAEARAAEKAKPKAKTFALDTEDDSKGKVSLINFFDGVEHHTFRRRLNAWNYLKEQGPAVVWAVNMEYDLVNLFGDWIDKFLTLTYNESAFIKGQWSGYNILFRDTLRHWLMSVKKMGDLIGLPKLEVKNGNYNDVKYNRRDTEIVFRFVEEMAQRYDSMDAIMKNTLPSTAFNLFKRDFCKINTDRPSEEICDMLMQAAYGGRVEIFKTGLLGGPIDCYDINSLYPSVMASKEYPLPECGQFVDDLDLKEEFIAQVTVRMPEVSIPCLPVRHNNKLVFPVGEFKGTWTAPEIRQAIQDGAEILKVGWVYSYGKRTCRPFSEWVNYIYGLRKKTDDPFMSYTLKLFLNSVFGKFTEAGKLLIYKNGHVSELANRPKHSNVVLGAYTTAYGRLVLLEALRSNSKHVCYCDTDSVFLQHSRPLKCGKELGEWKHEGRFKTCHFVLPKTYLAVKDDGSAVRKAKGIPAKAMSDFFETFSAQYESPIRFRESRRRHLHPNVWLKKVRTLKAVYEKRISLGGGLTAPLRLGEN